MPVLASESPTLSLETEDGDLVAREDAVEIRATGAVEELEFALYRVTNGDEEVVLEASTLGRDDKDVVNPGTETVFVSATFEEDEDGTSLWRLDFSDRLLLYLEESDWSEGDATRWHFTALDSEGSVVTLEDDDPLETEGVFNLYFNDLVAHWTMDTDDISQDDEGEDAWARDVANGFDAAIVGAEPRDHEGAFPGRTGYMDFPGDENDDTSPHLIVEEDLPQPDSFSIVLWARYKDLPSGNPGLIHAAAEGDVFSEDPEDKTVGIWVSEDGHLWGRLVDTGGTKHDFDESESALTAETWYQVALTVDAEEEKARLWVDGERVSELHALGSEFEMGDWSRLGIGRQADEAWYGGIDDVRLYRRALSGEDLAGLQPHSLTVDIVGEGAVELTIEEETERLEPDDVASTMHFPRPVDAELEAIPEEDWVFAGWELVGVADDVEDELELDQEDLSLAISGEVWAIAVFRQAYSVHVDKEGEGTVKVDDDPETLPYEKSADAAFNIELEAIPADGYRFVEWKIEPLGEAATTDDETEITVEVDGVYDVTAIFEAEDEPAPPTRHRRGLWITPRTINVRSRGGTIGARIAIPGVDLNGVDTESVKLGMVEGDDSVEATEVRLLNGVVMARFDRGAVVDILDTGQVNLEVTLTVNGDGHSVEDTVRVINPGLPGGFAPGPPGGPPGQD